MREDTSQDPWTWDLCNGPCTHNSLDPMSFSLGHICTPCFWPAVRHPLAQWAERARVAGAARQGSGRAW